jgi:cell division protein FtsN
VVKAAAVTHVVQKPAHHTAKETPPQRPAPVAETKTAQASSKTDFSVQVGSFGSSEQAEKLRSNLSQKGYPARVQLSDVPGQGLRYRVRVGNYAERTAASQSAQHLTVQEQVPAIVAGRD